MDGWFSFLFVFHVMCNVWPYFFFHPQPNLSKKKKENKLCAGNRQLKVGKRLTWCHYCPWIIIRWPNKEREVLVMHTPLFTQPMHPCANRTMLHMWVWLKESGLCGALQGADLTVWSSWVHFSVSFFFSLSTIVTGEGRFWWKSKLCFSKG